MKPGYATMLRVLASELVAALESANARPSRTNMDRVESIRREMVRAQRGEL